MPLSDRLAGGATVALTVLAALTAQAQERRLTLEHLLADLAPAHTVILASWLERVAENTNDRVAIEIDANLTVAGSRPDLFQRAQDGAADIIWTANYYTEERFPRSQVFELPTVYINDPVATNLAIDELFDEFLAEEYPGVKVLFMYVHTGNGIHTVDKEVRRPEDMAGLTIMAPGRIGGWTSEALGADPITMPLPEGDALGSGVVDGALLPFGIHASPRLLEQTQFHMEGNDRTRFGNSIFQVSMSEETWNSLPEDLQQAFTDASSEDFLREIGEVWRRNDRTVTEMIVEAGDTYVTLTDQGTDAFMQALEPVVDRWIADVSVQGIDGASLVALARDAISAHGGGWQSAAGVGAEPGAGFEVATPPRLTPEAARPQAWMGEAILIPNLPRRSPVSPH